MATANMTMAASSDDAAANYKDYSVHDLTKILEEIRVTNNATCEEVFALQSYVRRLKPEEFLASDPRSSTTKSLQLSDLDKFDIVTQELEELQKISAVKEEAYSKFNSAHEAIISEAGIQILELHRAITDFDKDIAKGDLNKQTGSMEGEKVVKYYDHRFKLRDTLKDKLYLKSASLKAKKTKLQSQIKQKEEAGEIRCEVDYEQLKIENKQCNEKFEDKNQELLKLKLSAGKTLQVLGVYKKKLHGICAELNSIENEMESRKDLLKRVTAEKEDVLQEKLKAEKINVQARKKVEDFRVPDVMDYVSERACIYELSRTLRAWERKVEIAEMALKSYRQSWKKMTSSASKSVLLQW